MTTHLALSSAEVPRPCAHCLQLEGHATNCSLAPTCRHCWRQSVITTDGRVLMIHAARCPGSSWKCPTKACDKRVVTGAETCPGCGGQRPCDIIQGCVLPHRHSGFCARTVPPTA